MISKVIEMLLVVVAMTFATGCSALADQGNAVPINNMGREATPAITVSALAPGWLERDTLTGDWGGDRTWLEEHGITLKPRLTQFHHGLTAPRLLLVG